MLCWTFVLHVFLISTITVECGLLDRFGTVEHGPLEPYLVFSQSQGPVMGPDSDSSFISFCHVPRRVSWWPFSLATLKLLLPLLNTSLPILWLKDETVTSSALWLMLPRTGVPDHFILSVSLGITRRITTATQKQNKQKCSEGTQFWEF